MTNITLTHLRKLKADKEKIATLTAYDATFANLLSEAGIELILVGDSLGTAMAGHKTTVPVTIEHIIYHAHNVCRANPKAFVMVDMPYMSYPNVDKALDNATQLMQAGGEMVKLEGGLWVSPIIKQLSEKGIPVCGHIGLTPQSVHILGGYKVQGRDAEKAKELLETALAHEESGAQMLVLECVPAELAQEITLALSIPVIGIGAGPHCDGQILVTPDMLGITPGKPLTFVKDFMKGETEGISGAIKAYVTQVKSGEFPSMEQSFS